AGAGARVGYALCGHLIAGRGERVLAAEAAGALAVERAVAAAVRGARDRDAVIAGVRALRVVGAGGAEALALGHAAEAVEAEVDADLADAAARGAGGEADLLALAGHGVAQARLALVVGVAVLALFFLRHLARVATAVAGGAAEREQSERDEGGAAR